MNSYNGCHKHVYSGVDAGILKARTLEHKSKTYIKMVKEAHLPSQASRAYSRSYNQYEFISNTKSNILKHICTHICVDYDSFILQYIIQHQACKPSTASVKLGLGPRPEPKGFGAHILNATVDGGSAQGESGS